MADGMLQDAGGPTWEVLQWQTEHCKMQVHVGLQHWPVNGLPWTVQHLDMVGTVCVATNLQKLVCAHTLLLSVTLCISLHPVITTPLHLPCCTMSCPCSIYIFYLVVFSLDLTYFHQTWPSPNSGCSLSTLWDVTCHHKYLTLVLHSISTLYSVLYSSVWN